MLTISKPLSAGQARHYHADEFRNARENYYTQGDDIRGEWHGALAREWGLSGAVAAGHKKVENRSWTTRYRGLIYIHASLRNERPAHVWLKRHYRLSPPADLPQGAIVAVATLADVVRRRNAKVFGRWFFGPYGFVLTKVRRLRRPVKTGGRLGLSRASAALRRRVERQIR